MSRSYEPSEEATLWVDCSLEMLRRLAQRRMGVGEFHQRLDVAPGYLAQLRQKGRMRSEFLHDALRVLECSYVDFAVMVTGELKSRAEKVAAADSCEAIISRVEEKYRKEEVPLVAMAREVYLCAESGEPMHPEALDALNKAISSENGLDRIEALLMAANRQTIPQLLNCGAVLCLRGYQWSEAIQLASLGRDLAARNGDGATSGGALHVLSQVLSRTGYPSDASVLSSHALEIFLSMDDSVNAARVLVARGNSAGLVGDYDLAIVRFKAARAVASSHSPTLFATTGNLARCFLETGKLEKAKELLEAASEFRHPVPRENARLTWLRAEVDTKLHQFDSAHRAFIQCSELFAVTGDSFNFCLATFDHCIALQRAGRLFDSSDRFGKLRSMAESLLSVSQESHRTIYEILLAESEGKQRLNLEALQEMRSRFSRSVELEKKIQRRQNKDKFITPD